MLYSISAILGLAAVVLASNGPAMRLGLGVAAFIIALCLWFFVFRGNHNLHPAHTDEAGNPIPALETAETVSEAGDGKD